MVDALAGCTPNVDTQVGHVLARHHAERISQMNATGLVNLLLRLLLGVSIPGPLIMLGMFLPYSRCAVAWGWGFSQSAGLCERLLY